MTRLTANIVILLMACVWAYLSVINNAMQPVSENFIYIGVLLAGGEVVEYLKSKGKQ